MLIDHSVHYLQSPQSSAWPMVLSITVPSGIPQSQLQDRCPWGDAHLCVSMWWQWWLHHQLRGSSQKCQHNGLGKFQYYFMPSFHSSHVVHSCQCQPTSRCLPPLCHTLCIPLLSFLFQKPFDSQPFLHIWSLQKPWRFICPHYHQYLRWFISWLQVDLRRTCHFHA